MAPAGWRVTGVFFATITGLMLQPMPGAQVVVLGATMLVVVGGVSIERALSGYASPSVWMVLAAMLMSRALRDSGLARRIALLFVRAIGRTSLGLGYALHLTDVTLATGVPSITARSASIVFPIARSIASLYASTPGRTADRLGTFLMTCMYQTSVVASAMFFYSSAANVLLGELAAEYAGVTITWTSWFVAGLVPGIVSSVAVPYFVFRVLPPELKHTPAAPSFAGDELEKLGPVRGSEAVVLAVFVGVVTLWVASSWVTWLSPALVALMGICVLFVTQALTWDGALSERSAWDVFVYGPSPMTRGSTPATPDDTMRASGMAPTRSPARRDPTISAAAPSLIPEAFPAVMTPSTSGRNDINPSNVVAGRGCSSSMTRVMAPLGRAISTG